MRITIGIATAGRRDVLSQTLLEIARQTRLPDRLIVCPADARDCDLSLPLPVKLEVISGPTGLCAQRNAILNAAVDADIVLFFDDDYFPAPNFLEVLEAEFNARPDAVLVTGEVLADGILGLGLMPDEARRVLAEPRTRHPVGQMHEVYKAYGCNMALNMRLLHQSGVGFDERLPLYAWLEDEDFSRAVARYGDILKSAALEGVHLGTKTSRVPGLRLGYSQIANPIYLWRKGTFPVRRAILPIVRNFAANLLRSLWPEPWVDRLGRLHGNVLAIADLCRGVLAPERILELSAKTQATAGTAQVVALKGGSQSLAVDRDRVRIT